MPRKPGDVGSEATPHFDGIRESIINDPTGVHVGVRSDVGEKKTLNVEGEKDEALKKFEKMTEGEQDD